MDSTLLTKDKRYLYLIEIDFIAKKENELHLLILFIRFFI